MYKFFLLYSHVLHFNVLLVFNVSTQTFTNFFYTIFHTFNDQCKIGTVEKYKDAYI